MSHIRIPSRYIILIQSSRTIAQNYRCPYIPKYSAIYIYIYIYSQRRSLNRPWGKIYRQIKNLSTVKWRTRVRYSWLLNPMKKYLLSGVSQLFTCLKVTQTLSSQLKSEFVSKLHPQYWWERLKRIEFISWKISSCENFIFIYICY